MNGRTIIPIASMLLTLAVGLTMANGQSLNHLLPKPQSVTPIDGLPLNLRGGIQADGVPSQRIVKAFGLFLPPVDRGVPAGHCRIVYVDSIEGAYDYLLKGYPTEAYRLTVDDGITIEAVDEVGVIRAVQTLAQLAEEDGEVPRCTIVDWPAFKLRGYMHDVGRSFIPFDELKRQMLLFARFKVNTLHLHLTENQAWRFEVKHYPQLTAAETMTREAGRYYSQQQCRELDELAYCCGMTLMPEIDMPGHSAAFERAMGHAMQTSEGISELKTILDEVAAVFVHAPYIHIGADETAITYPGFLPTMTAHVHSRGKMVVVWNPISNMVIDSAMGVDMTQMWSSAARKVDGLPNIDCRYNYVNHFDLFADLAGIYRSNIYYAQRGDAELAGTIAAVWNDRYVPSIEGIMAQNNVYANLLASAERAWLGGGDRYIEEGGAGLPTEGAELEAFADWERRFLYHKQHSLRDEPIRYVQQTQVRWMITDAFPNDDNAQAVFPPEVVGPAESYVYQGRTYGTAKAVGAGIYLRHTWGSLVPGFFAAPQPGTTAYAWTYVYSPVAQDAGALVETQNYSRSEKDIAPPDGSWDFRGSRLWLNGEELMPPLWDNTGLAVTHETPLANENCGARPSLMVHLRQGWNLVMLKLPYVDTPGVRLNKWMFTFVLTDSSGRQALDGIVYDPSQVIKN